ncbi:undecaprenyl-diphosphatase [Nocardiopsis mwathae]|uniref:Undecaprenyl-diphosphatase n=1 Tax=Nocardiopsis mwathae TaxID=1472723 RepID=A0A7W9YN71_9ACTN|nr:undecaprenyl-diphosphatase [Nocardiopsis mwathae]
MAPGPLPARRGVLATTMAIGVIPLLVLLPLVAARWDPLISFDLSVARVLYDAVSPSPALAHGLELWTEAFGTWAMRIVSLLAALWLLIRRQFSTAVWAGATVFLANLFGLIIKVGVDRPRPEFTDPIATGVGPSFPSGHALMAVTGMAILLFAVLPLLRGGWRTFAWVVAVGIAASTAFSRPLLGVHWTTDIVAGISLGVFTVALTLLLWTFLPPIARRWDRPIPAPATKA